MGGGEGRGAGGTGDDVQHRVYLQEAFGGCAPREEGIQLPPDEHGGGGEQEHRRQLDDGVRKHQLLNPARKFSSELVNLLGIPHSARETNRRKLLAEPLLPKSRIQRLSLFATAPAWLLPA